MQRRGNAAVLTWPTSKKGETMKALVFGGAGQRSWDNVDDPGIQDPTDVIVKVDTTTICGTDLHILKGDVPAVTEGRILGHEAVGTVVETGAAVSGLAEGDHVLVPAITSCGRCGPCKAGMAAHCEAVGGIGWIFGHLIDGVQAEYARVPFAETSVHKVPEGVTDEQVLFLADILPTGYEIGVQNGRVQPGRHGGRGRRRTRRPGGDDDRRDRRREPHHRGRSGRVTAQARTELRRDAHGGERRRRRARDPRADRRRRRRGDGGGRHPGDLRPLHADRPRGRHRGQHRRARRPTTLHLEDLWIKNITITTGLVSGSTVPTLLKLARDGRIEAEKLGTHHFGLDEIEQAYDVFAAAGEHDALKVVLRG